MSPAVSQPIPTAPGGRQPISNGAPPGAPPEGPPFHSALETEWARTATAEGQQQSRSQNPSPAEGEQTSATEAFDRLPQGSAPPNRHHSPHRAAATPASGKTTADLAPSAPTTTGSAPTPAVALPGGTLADETDQSAIAGGDPSQSPAAGLRTNQTSPATGRVGDPASGEEGSPNAGAGVAHNDALPSSPTSPADGEPAIPQGGAATAGAPAAPSNETPTAAALPAPRDDTTTGNGIKSALPGLPKSASAAGAGAQAHSTPKAPPTGDPIIPHSSPAAPSSHTNAVDLAKTPSSSTPLAGASADGISGGVGGLETSASPLTGAALDGSPAASPAELGSGAYGVGLQEAIESLHGTIQLAARQGLTQARISLQPEELGEIRINLTQTAQGLLARVSAESPAAAQALAAAHAQLRQSLSSLGINLTRLEIGHHNATQSGGMDANGNDQGGAARGEWFSGARAGRSTAIATPADSGAEADSPAADEPDAQTTATSHGTLIDVLA
jgi:flagellar hook-length control protein FliK